MDHYEFNYKDTKLQSLVDKIKHKRRHISLITKWLRKKQISLTLKAGLVSLPLLRCSRSSKLIIWCYPVI